MRSILSLKSRGFVKFITLALAIIILVLQVRLLSSDGGVGEWLSLQSKLDQLQRQIDTLETQNILLKKEVVALQSSPKAIETLARQKLGMIAEDEVFVKVIELPSSLSDLNDRSEKKTGHNNSSSIDQAEQVEAVDKP